MVSRVIENIEKRFDKMTVQRGREHNFLGMRIRYNENETATVTMKDYLKDAIEQSGLDIQGIASTPARRTLFEVDEKAEALPTEKAERFQRSEVAKLLYVSTRARMDILLPVAFCACKYQCTVQDESTLRRELEYVKGSLDLECIL